MAVMGRLWPYSHLSGAASGGPTAASELKGPNRNLTCANLAKNRIHKTKNHSFFHFSMATYRLQVDSPPWGHAPPGIQSRLCGAHDGSWPLRSHLYESGSRHYEQRVFRGETGGG